MTLVDYRLTDRIGHITLNRPDRHNALIPGLLDELRVAIAQAREDGPAALILDAAGSSFSTGGDVAGFFQASPAERPDYAHKVVSTLNAAILDLLTLPFPTLAVVQGMVTGGSAGLALACDLVIAGPEASFTPWYTRVGFSPDGGWTALMPERIGRGRTLDLLLTNRTLNAEEACRLGLVQYLADSHQLQSRARALATQLAAARAESVRHTLRLTRPDPERVKQALARELRHFLAQITSEEAHHGMARFLGRSS